MIPIKILTKEKAIQLGLTKDVPQRHSGSGMAGGGAVIKEEISTGKRTVLETYIEHPNGKKEITFMAKERVNYLKEKNTYNNYLKQFDRIEGKDIN